MSSFDLIGFPTHCSSITPPTISVSHMPTAYQEWVWENIGRRTNIGPW